MKKLMLLIFTAVLLMTACDKPDPQEDWVEYLQRYEWETMFIETGSSVTANNSMWSFYPDKIDNYTLGTTPYTYSHVVYGENYTIYNQANQVLFVVDMADGKNIIISMYGVINHHLKRGKRK